MNITHLNRISINFFFSLVILVSGLFCSLLLATPINSEKLFSDPKHGMVKISPDGKYVSSFFRGEKDYYLDLIETKTNKLFTTVTLGNDTKLNDYYWLNDKQIYFSVKYDNNPVLLLGELKNNKVQISHIKARGYMVNYLPEQEDEVLFAKLIKEGSPYYHLYKLSISDLKNNDFSVLNRIKHDPKKVSQYQYDKHTQRILTSTYDRDSESLSINYMPAEGGRWRTIITFKEVDYGLVPVGFSDERHLWVITNKDTDKKVLRKFDITSKTFGEIIYQHPDFDLTGAGINKNGGLDYVSYKQHGLSKKRYFDNHRASIIKRLSNTFENSETYVISASRDNNLNVLSVNGSNEPGEYYIYDQQLDRINRLLVAYPELENEILAPSKVITAQSIDGTQIEAFLTLPVGINQHTLLVMPHGGPIEVQESDRFNQTVQYYASRGFSVVRINFRGSAGFGKSFMNQGVGEFGQLIEEDITAVVNQIREQYDFKYMCSIGASYGGYSAAMLAIKYPQQYDCVVASFGVFDLPLQFNISNFRSGEKYRSYMAKIAGQYDKKMTEISPVYLFQQLKVPILLIAGKDDPVTNFEHTNRFKYVLELNNHPVETMFYENTGHGHPHWSGDKHEAAVTSDFLHRTLGLSMPEPAQLSEEANKAIADDYVNIADGYKFDDNVDDDDKKAYLYYQKAANYGHPRAIFNMGSRFHRGDRVPFDMEKAIKLYKKSADLDLDRAYARLGRMHMEGDYLAKDWEKALEYLIKAQSLDDSPFNNTLLARFYCTAPESFKDFDKCLQLIDLEQYKKRSKGHVKAARKGIEELLSWVIVDSHLTPEEYAKVRKFAIETFEIDETELEIINKKEGEFHFELSDNFSNEDDYQLSKAGYDIQANNDEKSRFGMIFETDASGVDYYNEIGGLAVRWMRTKANGQKDYPYNDFYYGSVRGKWYLLWPMKSIKESASWTMEIYDLQRNLLYSKAYNVQPAPQVESIDSSDDN